MNRPTTQQMEAFANFLEKNPGIAKGTLRTASAKQITKMKWDEISTNLNSLGGVQKDGRGWAKYWADRKCALKKISIQHAQKMRETGGDPLEAPTALVGIDQKLFAAMGGQQYFIGDLIASDPLPPATTIDHLPTSSNCIVKDETLERYSVDHTDDHIEETLEFIVQTEGDVESAHTVSHESRDRSPIKGRHHSTDSTDSTESETRQRPRQARTRNFLKSLNEDRRRFSEIENRRVEVEAATARSLREAADNIGSVATAINNLAASISGAAHIIAQALSASAIKRQL